MNHKTFLLTTLIMINPVTMQAMIVAGSGGGRPLGAAPAGIVLSSKKKAALLGALTATAGLGTILLPINPSSNEFIKMGINLAKLGICVVGARTLLGLASRL